MPPSDSSWRRLLDHATAAQHPFRGGEVLSDRPLRSHPIKVAIYPPAQIRARCKSERPKARGIGDQGPHLARPELAWKKRRDRLAQAIREESGQVPYGDRLPGPNVEDLPIRARIDGYEQVRPRHVLDEDQIARLPAILVDDRRQIIGEAGAEDGDDPGIGVEQRLPRTVGGGVAERNRRDARGSSPADDQPLLDELRDGIDVLAAGGRSLVGRD